MYLIKRHALYAWVPDSRHVSLSRCDGVYLLTYLDTMYLNPQIHYTKDTLTIHVGYIGIPSRIRILSSTCGCISCSHHVSRMYPACFLITLADTCISHVQLYPVCILHLRYVPLRIHLRYTYPNMYLGSIQHVSLIYPRTRLQIHLSRMYP